MISVRGGITGLILILPSIVFGSLMGLGICLAAGWDPHYRELFAAASVSIVAAAVSAVPLFLASSFGHDEAAAAQAGLAALVLLMLATVALAILVTLAGWLGQRESFVWWLLLNSWLSLIGIAWTAVNMMRSGRPEKNA